MKLTRRGCKAIAMAIFLASTFSTSAPCVAASADKKDEKESGKRSSKRGPDQSAQQNSATPITPPIMTSPAGAALVEQKSQGARPGVALVESFDGLGVGFEGPQGAISVRNPSDNSLAVGPNHIFQIVNTRIAIFTKKGKQFDKTGKVLYGPVPTNTIFKGFGGACETTNNGDAVVRYDQLADRWMASPAIDGLGNIGIGYSFGGTPNFAGQRFAGRAAKDPLGQLTLAETVLVEGEGAQNAMRWEDYTQTAVDPSDDCTIWYVGDYIKKGATSYSTRIGAFRLPGCRGKH